MLLQKTLLNIEGLGRQLDPDLDLEADLGVDTVKQAEVFAAVRGNWDLERDENLKLRDFPTMNHVAGWVREAADAGARVAAGGEVRADGVLSPTLIDGATPDMKVCELEVFGPVVHVLRFAGDRLQPLLDAINATGYGLTLGLHSRIDETVQQVVAGAHVGNIYVNRNMVGAVVGVQPFGG